MLTPLSVQGYYTQPCIDDLGSVNRTLQRIENEWPLYSSGDELSHYVQQLTEYLARIGGYPYPVRVYVVRNLAPNAFSIGGGNIFITEGAVRFAQNEAELVAILAHELGHEIAGHFCQVTDTGFDLFSNVPSSRQVGVGSLTQEVDVIKEQQADQIGLDIMMAGSYDTYAMISLAKRMPLDGKTHLIDNSRLQALEQTISLSPRHTRPDSNEFLTIKRNLVSH